MNKEDEACIKRYSLHFIDSIINLRNSKMRSYLSPLNQNYNGLVHIASKLIIELAGDMQKEEVYLGLFTYLYRNGFFSKNGEFAFGKPEKELEYLLGLPVINGVGVCRNIATMFKDIINEVSKIRGTKSEALCLAVNSDHYRAVITNNEMPSNFKMKSAGSQGNSEGSSLPDSIFKENHLDVIVETKENDEVTFKIFDPTNFIIENLDLNDINDERDGTAMDLRWNLTDMNFFADKTEDEIIQILKKETMIQSQLGKVAHKPLDKRTMELIMRYSINQCEKNHSKISEFYKDTKPHRKLIIKGMNDCIEINERFAKER